MKSKTLSYTGIAGDTTIMRQDGHKRVKVADVYVEELKPVLATAPEMLAALQGLFEHCAMIHNVWGDGCNREQANAAVDAGRAAIAKATAA